MNGRIDELMNGWLGEWIKWINEWIDRWMNGWTNGWICELMDEKRKKDRMIGWIDLFKRKNKYIMDGRIIEWMKEWRKVRMNWWINEQMDCKGTDGLVVKASDW